MPGLRMGRIFLSPVPFREACSRRLLVGFRGPWRRIKEDVDDAALRIFSVSPSTLLSLSVYSPLESSFQLLSFGFRFSLPPIPPSSGLHCGSRTASQFFSISRSRRSPLPLQLSPSRFLLLPFPPFENFSKSSFSREFAPIHNLSSRRGKT